MVDTFADALARIKNALAVGKKEVVLKHSNMIEEALNVLKQEEMINEFEVQEGEITVTLKYLEDESSFLTHIERVSSPGQRIYVKARDITPVLNGRGIGIISTSKGVMASPVAKSMGLGGEYLCKVW
ncbi:30S ribosomal protein S8 [Candidatus Dojkabacteria bacterium]|nr:30S ribosomal protein S8 [Candidatus Dojkabacteria bacterium]